VRAPISSRGRRPFTSCERAAQTSLRAARLLPQRELDHLSEKHEIEQHRDSPGGKIKNAADRAPGQRL
jgi:hypothetical protein